MLETLNQPYIILAVSILITVGVRSFSNIYSKKYTKNTADTAFFTLCSAVFSMVVVLVFVLGDGFQGVSWFTFLMAILFAAVSFVNTYSATRALVLGPLAYTCVIAAASSIIGLSFRGDNRREAESQHKMARLRASELPDERNDRRASEDSPRFRPRQREQ